MPPSKAPDKMQRPFCKTTGITPSGIFIKQPTQIIAANKATNEEIKAFLFFMAEAYKILA